MNITATTLSAGYAPLHAFGHSLDVMKHSCHECATPNRNILRLRSFAETGRASSLGLDDLHQLHVDHLA